MFFSSKLALAECVLLTAAGTFLYCQLACAAFAQAPVMAARDNRPQLVLQSGHAGTVRTLTFSADGRLLASGSADGSVKLWDPPTHTELRTLVAGSGAVNALTFSPDGTLLASGRGDVENHTYDVDLWNVATAESVCQLKGHMGEVRAVAFAPDGKTLATSDATGELRLWSVRGCNPLRRLREGIGEGDYKVFLSFDGPQNLVELSGSGTATWNIATGEPKMEGMAGLGPFSFSLATKLLASTNVSGGVWVVALDLKQGKKLGAHEAPVTSFAFSPDGSVLASGSEDSTVRLWDVHNSGVKNVLKGHGGRDLALGRKGSVTAVAFSPSGEVLASGGEDDTIRFWDVASGRQLAMLAGSSGVGDVATTRDSRVLVATNGTQMSVWDLEKGVQAAIANAPGSGLTDRFDRVAISPEKKIIVTGGFGTVSVYSADSPNAPLQRISAHRDWVSALIFSPDGANVASASWDGSVKLWNTSTWLERDLGVHRNYVNDVVFSPDGKTVASVGGSADQLLTLYTNFQRDNSIRLWDVATGKLRARFLAGHNGGTDTVAFFPDGQSLVTGGEDNTVKLWRLGQSDPVTAIGHAAPVLTVAVDPSGRTIASGGRDGTVILWDASLRKQRARALVDPLGVFAIHYALDGRWLLAAGAQDTITLLDAENLRIGATIVSVNGGGWLVASPDGFFDGSPDAWQRIMWRFGTSTFDVVPVEIFFNQFYEPGLLAEILAGQRPQANVDFASIDRRQPQITLAAESANQGASRLVTLRLTASEVKADTAHATGAGVRDVRLFRNGSLVKVWHGNLNLASDGQVVLEPEVPIVAGENKFIAYGFSKSDIKSLDASLTITGAVSLKREGIGYLLAVGIDDYASSDYNLKYAVADAQDFASEVAKRQLDLKNYSQVKVTPLLNGDATKANILAALDRLGGAPVDRFTAAQQRLLTDLAPIQPEDVVFIYYSGHGYAYGPHFYLLPHDMVPPQRVEDLAKEAHVISEIELGDAFEKIGASRSVFVIDACQSGRALESEENRRGPMNSKGLAQLAYEKGMYVLTASQGYQAALESTQLGHGVLTYALVEEGLKTRAAAVEGRVELRHWLDFATQRVPQLQLAIMQEAQEHGRGFSILNGEDKKIAELAKRTLQRPRVFYRREAEAQPFIVAVP